jgi:hypothetical protein
MIAPIGDAETVLERCDLLARCSEEPDRLTRRFATPALSRARELTQDWMRDAGMATRCDSIGNLVGRLEGAVLELPAGGSDRRRKLTTGTLIAKLPLSQ